MHELSLTNAPCSCLYLFSCLYLLEVQACYPGHKTQLSVICKFSLAGRGGGGGGGGCSGGTPTHWIFRQIVHLISNVIFWC